MRWLHKPNVGKFSKSFFSGEKVCWLKRTFHWRNIGWLHPKKSIVLGRSFRGVSFSCNYPYHLIDNKIGVLPKRGIIWKHIYVKHFVDLLDISAESVISMKAHLVFIFLTQGISIIVCFTKNCYCKHNVGVMDINIADIS